MGALREQLCLGAYGGPEFYEDSRNYSICVIVSLPVNSISMTTGYSNEDGWSLK